MQFGVTRVWREPTRDSADGQQEVRRLVKRKNDASPLDFDRHHLASSRFPLESDAHRPGPSEGPTLLKSIRQGHRRRMEGR